MLFLIIVLNIYLKYKNCTHSTERHIYVVNIYKEFLDQQNSGEN